MRLREKNFKKKIKKKKNWKIQVNSFKENHVVFSCARDPIRIFK